MIVEFQSVETSSTGMRTVSLGAYDDMPTLPLPGMKVKLELSGPDAPYKDGDKVWGIVATTPETTIYVPQSGIDAMVFLENVQPATR